MQPYDSRLYDIFDDDSSLEYHQDYQESTNSLFTNMRTVLLMVICFITIFHQILTRLCFNVLPLPEIAWNTLVYLTPSRLLDIIENYGNPQISNTTTNRIYRTHAAKSETMRRILNLDGPVGFVRSTPHTEKKRSSPDSKAAKGTEDRPAGLGNWDNSCYQNSILQGLASLKHLHEYLNRPIFEKDYRKTDEEDRLGTKMTEALRSLIRRLNDPVNNGTIIWTPASLKYMSSWQQQDAQEYFSKILDEIDKEISTAVNLERRYAGFISSPPETSLIAISSHKIVRNPLEGLIAQRVGCLKCGYSEGLSLIPFNCLTVPLKRCRNSDIFECLDEYTKLEIIDGVECGKCTLVTGRRVLRNLIEEIKDHPENQIIRQQSEQRLSAINNAIENDDYEEKTLLKQCKATSNTRVTSMKTRQAVVARPPKSLVVHFNRSLYDETSGDLRKNYCQVSFPKELDLGSWCLGSVGNLEDLSREEWIMNPDWPMVASSMKFSRQRGPIYELRAVVTHYGRHENGHYVCFKRYPTNISRDHQDQWWRLSDEEVTRVDEESVLSQGGVFMLFYDCIEPVGKLHPSVQLQDTVVYEKKSASMSKRFSYQGDSFAYSKEGVNDLAISSNDTFLAAYVPLPNDPDDELREIEASESSSQSLDSGVFSLSKMEESVSINQNNEVDLDSRNFSASTQCQLLEAEAKNTGHSGSRKKDVLSTRSSLVMA